MQTIPLTMPQLQAALLRWAQDARDGKTCTHEEADALPVEQVAAESADYLWQVLSAPAAA